MSPTALLPLPEEFEEIEAVTIIDVLRRADLSLTIAGLTSLIVTGSHHITLQADMELEAALDRPFDLVVLAGGPGTKHLLGDDRLLSLLQRQSQAGRWIAAICAAPTVLAKAKLLEGKTVTAHPTVHDRLGGVSVLPVPVVVDGKIVTGSGPGTAMVFALKLVSLLRGEAIAQQLATAMVVPE
jgi:4-methyl-5(b-hydroxyethyl)-thiazole monophosphate biosynthesis